MKSLYKYKIAELERKIEIMGIRPLDVLVVGATGAGKSTTLNSFFQKYVAKVGIGVDPETMDVFDYELNDYIRFWDTPGLGDNINNDLEHSKLIIDMLNKSYKVDDKIYGFIDIVLLIVDATSRDLGTAYKILKELIVDQIQEDRILVAVNQADMAMKGRNWDYDKNLPNIKLVKFLEQQTHSVQRRIYEATGVNIPMPIYYSAKYNYGVKKLYDFILENFPKERRKFLFKKKQIA